VSGGTRRRPSAETGQTGRFAVRRAPAGRQARGSRLRLLVLAAVAAAAVGLGWWLTDAGVFAVRTVATGGYRYTDETALGDALRPLLGRNLWAVDRGAVAAALAPLPWVRDVSVRRNLPADVQVDFREWRPLLALEAADDAPLQVLVEDGRVLAFPPQLPAPDLPVLVGVAARRGEDGVVRLAAEAAGQVLDLMQAAGAAGLESVGALDFVVARPEGFAIVLQGRRGSILVGREDFAARLERYVILCSTPEAGQDVDPAIAAAATAVREATTDGREVDLRWDERIVVSTR
jgi:cell division septal protein FtsQ